MASRVARRRLHGSRESADEKGVLHRRLARALLYAGVLGAVAATSKFHAAEVAAPAYDYTGSSRFSWSLAYAALLGLTAYGLGLPELARTRKVAWLSALAAVGAGAAGISVLQLAVGDALLPRFVVFGAAGLLAAVVRPLRGGRPGRPGLRRGARPGRGGGRGRRGGGAALRAGRGARAVCVHRGPRAPRRGDGPRPAWCGRPGRRWWSSTGRPRPTRPSWPRWLPLHADGVRVRTLSLFYEEWLGKLPAAELERVALLFDIGELHRARYGRLKRLFDVVVALAGLAVLVAVTPVVVLGDLAANRGPAALPPDPGRQAEPALHHPQVPDDAGPGRRVDGRGRPPDHPLRRLPPPHPPRRAASGPQRPAGRPLHRRPPTRAAAVRRRAHGQAAVLRPPPPRPPGHHRAGPR